jgi:hypothetical protein
MGFIASILSAAFEKIASLIELEISDAEEFDAIKSIILSIKNFKIYALFIFFHP